jgi:hypothetical protein
MTACTRLAIALAVMSTGCYVWAPANVDYARSHPWEPMRVTDSAKHTVIAKNVEVDGDALVLHVARPIEQPLDTSSAPVIERRVLSPARTIAVVTTIVGSVILAGVSVVMLATYRGP